MTQIDPKRVIEIANALETSEQTRKQIDHVSAEFPDMTIEDAYAIQRAWMDIKLKSGRKPIGRKIGLTSRAMQRASGITEPDYGLLLDNMLIWSGEKIDTDRFIIPRIETEIAFKLKHDLEGPNCTHLDVMSATEWVIPALELIDARIKILNEAGQKRKVMDTISDNAANGAIILGGEAVRPEKIDLARVSATLNRNETIEESGVAAAVLGHPAIGVAWLANKLAAYGEKLHAGEIVLGGSFTAPVPAVRGDTFYANYGELGVISVYFE